MEYSIKLVDQFLDELEKIVYVAHIYYGGRNYLDGDLLQKTNKNFALSLRN